MSGFDYDVLVVGSGFGGSVSALRLTEKGYKVGVLEAGARFEDADFASTSFDLKKYLFAPQAGCYGIQRIDAIKDCLILAGAGVGGGSLVYANTLYEPLDAFYDDPSWSHITDWKSELAPYYDQAKRMLGVVENPVRTASDDVMVKVAEEMGVGDTFHPTPVGVFFGGPEHGGAEEGGVDVEDPFFGGAGPRRTTCRNCGECMTGCRHNAKNTLVKNYLYLAEQLGATVHPLTTVTRVRPLAGGGYRVDVRWTKAKLSRRSAVRSYTAEQVVFSAAALGTQKLLHRLKATGDLPGVSDRLGVLTRTNSESILGALAPDLSTDYSKGVAITSSWHPDPVTHIEPVRYGKGSNAMALMQTVLTDGDGPGPRWQTWLKELWRERRNVLDLYDMKHWSERTVIALVMQTLDNSITTFPKRTRWLAAVVEAGPRRPEPDVDPDRQRGDASHRGHDRRQAGRHRGRAVQPAAHGALHRWLHDRGVPRDRRGGPLPADVRAPGAPRRRRLRHLGQPRREPVADDHRPGRARDGLLAQQGRGGHAATAGRGVRARRSGRAPSSGGARRGAGGAAAAHRRGQLETPRRTT